LTCAFTVKGVLTYYRDPTVEVTSRALNIHGHVFMLLDLEEIWHRESVPGANGARRKGREIWAVWRGKELMLLRIEDKTRFGQIYRAIQRAFEQLPS